MDSILVYAIIWSFPALVGILCLCGVFRNDNDIMPTNEQIANMLGYTLDEYLTNDRVFQEVQAMYHNIMEEKRLARAQARNTLLTGISVGTTLYMAHKLSRMEIELQELRNKKS